jgi:hypothetical protein
MDSPDFRDRLEENLSRIPDRQEAAAELADLMHAAIGRAHDLHQGSAELQGRLIDAFEVIVELAGTGSAEDIDGLACIAAGH